ncbi:hypothetical protein BH11PSE10_BH11PSE10_09810 [soil metagenome]
MNAGVAVQQRSLLTFFALVFALSVPFWWIGSATDLQLMPGLSVSVLMAFGPMVAALVLVHRESGMTGVRKLLKRSVDFRRITDRRWYLPILLLMPLTSLAVYGVMRGLGLPLPAPADLSVVPALLMLLAFFVGALGEELGWSGYVLDPLQRRWNAFQAGLILGVVGVAWHLVPLLFVMHRGPAWIAWWCLYAVAFRVLVVWLFNNTGGSVFAVALFHATLNLSFMLFPVNGSHFDMRLGGIVMACLATAATVLWGATTLARYSIGGRRRPVQIAAGLGVLGLAIAGTLQIIMPVFRFPQPTGPYAIGTLTYHWVDAARADIFTLDPNARRELMVQVWYPADAGASPTTLSKAAPYLQEAAAVMAAFARIHGQPAFLFSRFKDVTTHAVTSARVAAGQARYPVLILPEGATGFRQINTFQVEELASHGYIVVAVDQPGAAATVVFPDGHEVVGLPVAQLQALIRPSHMPGARAPALQGRALKARSIIPFLTQDISFVLDQLSVLNQADPQHLLTGRLDLQRVGGFGVSLGGIVTSAACLTEPRLRACLMMDAPMPSEVVAAGLTKPSLWITRDAASMRLERARAGGWSEAEIEAHQTSMRAVYSSLPGAGYFVQVPGTFHSNFMDIPNWTPLASWLDLAGPIDGQRAHDIINAYSLAFFDRHLLGRPASLLEGPAERYPEVLFESRPPRTAAAQAPI